MSSSTYVYNVKIYKDNKLQISFDTNDYEKLERVVKKKYITHHKLAKLLMDAHFMLTNNINNSPKITIDTNDKNSFDGTFYTPTITINDEDDSNIHYDIKPLITNIDNMQLIHTNYVEELKKFINRPFYY